MTQQTEDMFWMVYGGHCSAPTYKHPSYELAVKEAERLCALHNKPFFILEAKEKIERVTPFTHTKLVDNSEVPF